jgi:hypothetical protein
MEVVVGPVPAASVGAFAVFARHTLEGAGPGADVPSDAARAFLDYIAEWDALAGEPGDVTWVVTAEPEVVEYLVYAFWRVAKEMNDEAGAATVVPPDGAAFYWLLVGALLSALDAAGGSHAELAANLREFWPGDHEIP